ncbi:hypothetical protein L249_6176, partial [Ophiocordyceps polyrhachis-furcata BCC 54312]
VLAIYVDSYAFVFASALLQHGVGLESSVRFIYLFLVEKAHMMRSTPQSRFRSRLYLFNSFGMLGLYVVVVVVNFVFRIAKIRDGTCVIGMRGAAMIPLISFDAVVNVYLTGLFLIPLTRLYTFRHTPTPTTRSQANIRLRKAALRTFCGAVFTLLSSIV